MGLPKQNTTWTLGLAVEQIPDDGDVISVYAYDGGRLTLSFNATPGHAAPRLIEFLAGSQLEDLRVELEHARDDGSNDPAAVRALLAVVEVLLV